MIKSGDVEYLAEYAISQLTTSDRLPWPALDFVHDGRAFTLTLSVTEDVFTLHDVGSAWSWRFHFRTDLSTMKFTLAMLAAGEPVPLPRDALAYLAAIIKADVRKYRPTSLAVAASMN